MKLKSYESFERKDESLVWHVTLRIIEGRDLPKGKLRTRATLQEQQKASRLVVGTNPIWKQNLVFTLCDMDFSTVSQQFINLKVTKTEKLQEKSIGHWKLPLSAIMELENRTLNSKWVGLRSSQDTELDEHCGFLKVSVTIQNGLESYKVLHDDMNTQDIWFITTQEIYNLRFRLIRIEQIASDFVDFLAKKNKCFEKGYMEISAGEHTILTNRVDFSISETYLVFNQELFLPFVWPSVLTKITFKFYGIQGNNTTLLAEALINLQDLYRIGESGFMPIFGPSFINFHSAVSSPNTELQKHKYVFRLGCCIDTVDCTGFEELKCSALNALSLISELQHSTDEYTLYCSFHTCNIISPMFGSSSVSFHVSMGSFGSTGTQKQFINCSTIGTMPLSDEHRYFCMPWGNHKPVAKFDCFFENIEYRMHQNPSKVCYMFSQILKLVERRNTHDSTLASSYLVESLDHATQILRRLQDNHFTEIKNDLDNKMENFRKSSISSILKEIESARNSMFQSFDSVPEEACRLIAQFHDILRGLAQDIQISLPDILITMVADRKVVGFARVSAQEVFYHSNDSYRGMYCGKIRPFPLKWDLQDSKNNQLEEFVGILHAKLWFGRSSDELNIRSFTEPAEIKYFTEIIQYEKKNISKQWDRYGPEFTDERCVATVEGHAQKGNWVVRGTQEMWIRSNDNSTSSVADRVYQLEEKKNGKWVYIMKTDYFGKEMDLSSPPEGYEYEGKFRVDAHTNNGIKNGWVYSSQKVFWGNTFLDKNDRPCYHFRRRCISKTRKSLKVIDKSFEDYKKEIGLTGFEYSRGIDQAFHCEDLNDANFRRRIFLLELEKRKIKATPRVFEVHNCTTVWQLRCYILWAKDLLPLVKDAVGLFARVTFLHRAAQTLVTRKSQNPVWNQTLLFDKIPIPGAMHEICINPPIIHLEVRGEKADNSEFLVGSFQICPVVVADALDERCELKWNILLQHKEKSKGALLSSFELFHINKNQSILPEEPPRKKISKRTCFNIPSDIKPKFQQFSVDILCWGLRNMRTSVIRKPFLKISIGSQEFNTSIIRNLRVNPNFPEPIITFPEVNLPRSLEFSPPIVFSLYDSSYFVKQRLIGVCQISKYNEYILSSKKRSRNALDSNWKAFDDAIVKDTENEKKSLALASEKFELFDWWSKYYASQGALHKAPQFFQSGMELLKVLEGSLEDSYGINGFADFLERFKFIRCQKDMKDYEDPEVVGELKGKLFINKLGNSQKDAFDPPAIELIGPVKCCVRVYVIEGSELVSVRANGLINPYVVIQCGDQKQSFRDIYQADTCNPVFGNYAELNLLIPVQKDLQIHVLDRREFFSDEQIGSTSIDIEDRLLTKWRATVGLPLQYNKQNASAWRDQMSPLEILKRYCQKMQIQPPKIIKSDDDIGLEILECKLWFSQIEHAYKEENLIQDGKWINDSKPLDFKCSHSPRCRGSLCISQLLRTEIEPAALDMKEMLETRRANRRERLGSRLQNVALRALNLMRLTPEHVETRTLHSTGSGNQVCGNLRMFVDIFPINYGSIPPPINIKPRQPINYQLRICVFNVANIVPARKSFGQAITDLYAKVYINGSDDIGRTDVHYRADGYAEFNWRFVYDLKFDPFENKIIIPKKITTFGKKKNCFVDPIFIVELWDKKRFEKDTKIGEMHFDISNFREGYSDPQRMIQPKKRRRACCTPRSCFCSTWCSGPCGNNKQKHLRKTVVAQPFTSKNDGRKLSLFEIDTCRGWWPVVIDAENEQNDGFNKKNEDISHSYFVTGSVEMEFCLLTAEDAAQDPVGKNRKEPNHSPYLPKPYRSSWNTFYITSRIRPFFGWCYHAFAPQILIWIIMATLFFFTVYGILSNWPLLVVQIFS